MAPSKEKLLRLAHVARRYYLEDWKQIDIARELGVSRPLVSRMLGEARELGVVQITVYEPGEESAVLLDRLRLSTSLQGGVLVEDGRDDDATNQLLSQGAVDLLRQIGARRLGVGWGHLIGQLVTWLEPCEKLGAAPHFLYLPALPESLEEKQLLCSTEVYRQIQDQWVQMDTALVNIGNYPSSPDFASLVRYGSLLQQQHTCGRLLVYYFNEAGTVIQSDQDFAIQIPLELLKQCPHIVGVCSANTSEKALRGALRSGIFTHIAARAELVKSLLGQ